MKPRDVKPPMWLLPYKPLRAIAAAFHDGAVKYAPNDWRRPQADYREVYGSALLRHVLAWIDPDEPETCPKSGLHHLAHAGANVMILLYHEGVDYVRSNAVKRELG